MLDSKPRLGFVGLGIMGSAMVTRLLQRGWQVTVWNLEPECIGPVVALGATAAASPAAATRASDIILVCVLHTEALENCVYGPNGISEAGSPEKIIVDHSTVDPAATRRFAKRLHDLNGMRWVDAPVSGGPIAAAGGTLTVMAGGSATDIAEIRPVTDDLAANFTHIGPCGAGQTAKIIGQAIVGSGYVLMAEALTLAEAAGLDAARIPQCFAGGHADSSLLQQIFPQMQARLFDPPRSYARQLLKDLKAVKEFAHALDLDLPVVGTATARYSTYVEQGNGMRDSASILQLYEREVGTQR
jgi:3-hydroxyisobutyrate dehydrogenase